MWFFRSPEIVFGQDALDYLLDLEGHRALIITDRNMEALGLLQQVTVRLDRAKIGIAVFAEVEPNPSLDTVRRGAAVALVHEPDWIIGLGGGSCLDAAKAIWVLYERPDLAPDAIAPVGTLGLRRKARLIAIPTTSGTGAETTWPIVLSDLDEERKLSLGHPENMPDIAIVDPALTAALPAQITADTGMDALTHAVEGYTSQWSNDYSDGLCLIASQLVFEYLARACADGRANGGPDPVAREKMHNAACIAGLGFGNSMAALAHALGHALGAIFPVPHGRAVGLFLPYTIEFTARGAAPTRYGDLARFLGLAADTEAKGAALLVTAVRELAERVGQPLSLQQAGISREDFEARLPKLVENALCDSCAVLGLRAPTGAEIVQLFRYAYGGQRIDF
jgi:alcohol dehydrogenase class IV